MHYSLESSLSLSVVVITRIRVLVLSIDSHLKLSEDHYVSPKSLTQSEYH